MRVLAVGDIHAPATHPKYRQWCVWLAEKFDINRVVLIGDVVDHHNISFHRREVDAPSVHGEFAQASDQIGEWHESFPKAVVTIGNHDERIHRLAASVNIPGECIKTYNELWDTDGWDWRPDVEIDGVHYFHGTGHAGERPAYNAALRSMRNTVIGHVHRVAGFQWLAGPTGRLFGMNVGCGVDVHHVAMRYGRNLSAKPVLGAGIIIDGVPQHFAMPCGPKEKWRR